MKSISPAKNPPLCEKRASSAPSDIVSPNTGISWEQFLKCEHMWGSTIVKRSQSDDLGRLSEEGFCFFFFFFTDFTPELLTSFSLPIFFLLFFFSLDFLLVCSFISFALPSFSILGFFAFTSWKRYYQVNSWSCILKSPVPHLASLSSSCLKQSSPSSSPPPASPILTLCQFHLALGLARSSPFSCPW